ncbi:periplasmic sensor signal transduction histidine kinase [Candidatus Vecturithrix granuli]|uniref:histidine kinase n=1 Tax=Vecturithrix granuli TaxID=1499967 RepID=A0A081CAT8_VECG1|nr:periplasmic sensor signal transduction histidine kinase [Candidatus Vecturithrix granuli]
MRISLKIKLIGLMVVILGATIFVSYIIFERSEKELLQQVIQHIKSVENVGNVFEIQQLLTTNIDQSMQHKILVRMSQRGRVSQVSLLNSDYTVIASSNPEDVGLTLQELENRRILGINASFWETLLKKHIKKYDVTIPVYENGREKGYLNIVLVMNDLEFLIKKAKYSNMFWIISIFVAGTIVAIVMVKRFTMPIDELVTASKIVAEGNFDVTIHSNGSGEFDTLVAGFNEMTQKLREHKTLEERVHRSEHMAALGELGARLAHEIRNPLNSISLIIDHLRDRFSPVEERERQRFESYAANVKTELKRLNKLVTDFLQVSRPLHPEIRPIRVQALLEQIVQLLYTEAEKHQIQLNLDILPEDLEIQGDEELLKTACLNIALNALQAMQDGGRLNIQAKPDEQRPGKCLLIFSDTGPGIPPELHENIFQPYFTTKKDGTGLGLSIVNRIIADHHGSVLINSEQGQGTTMTLVLPITEDEKHKVRDER